MHTVPTDHPRPLLATVDADRHRGDVTIHAEDDRDLPARLVVRPWFDPGLALRGVDPRSEYVERFWTGVVGPSVVLLSRRLARGLGEHPAGFSMAPADTARAIGLSGGLGPNAPMARTLERACMFGLMRRSTPEQLEVRTHVPLLTPRQLRKLPLAVRSSHQHWLAEQRHEAPPAA
jgi:hypothetical protein